MGDEEENGESIGYEKLCNVISLEVGVIGDAKRSYSRRIAWI